jgi:radical SAM protein with 4Fe4S-binding SPASM domain
MKVDCRSPFKYVRILYNGDVQLCQQFRIGNIHETPLLDLWFGEEAQRVRRKVQADASTCHACDYYRFCIKAAEIDPEREENFYAQHVRPSAAALPQLIEEGYKGFNLVRFRGRVYGLAQSVGPFDLFLATDEVIQAHVQARRCVLAESAAAVKTGIDRLGEVAPTTTAPGAAWPTSVEGYFRQVAQGFATDTEEGRRLRALYEELGEPVPGPAGAPGAEPGLKGRLHAN